MYKLHSFWYTFGNPFFTAIAICVAVGIPCLILYLCTIFAIVTYKKRQRLNSAHNVVNIEAIRDVKNISDIKNHNDNDNDKAMTKAKDVVESTFFLNDLRTLEEINAGIGPEMTDFLPIAFINTDDFFE